MDTENMEKAVAKGQQKEKDARIVSGVLGTVALFAGLVAGVFASSWAVGIIVAIAGMVGATVVRQRMVS